MTRISFIMPTFNRADLIVESLHAILAAASDDDEILVMDDGSTDATAAVVRDLAPRVRYAHQRNAGKAAALNRALELTDGDYVWICDDDDILRPGVVDPMVSALESSGVDLVFGRYERFRTDASGNRVMMGAGYWPDLATGPLARHMLEDAFAMQNAALVQRSCFARVGLFDTEFLRSQDYEMFVRLALGCEAAFVDAVIFDQRKHDGVRGPTAARHAADRVDAVWLQYDRRIFEANAARLTLPVFEAMFEGGDRARIRRAALLQRACVHARHGLWSIAIADLQAAATVLPNSGLDPVERAICNRILSGKHGFVGVEAPETLAALRALMHKSALGGAIIRAVIAGLFWRLRRDTPAMRHAARDLLSALAGPTTLARAFADHLLARRAIGDKADHLRQKPVLHLPFTTTF